MIVAGAHWSLKNIFNYSLKIASIGILFAYLYLAVMANTDLAEGRFVLFMDERITFDGVKRILHPVGLSEFLNAVFDGGDQRYGRILWNVIAIFSLVPELFFGESGQIVAGRMLQYILLVGGLLIISFGILKSWFFRFVLFLCFFSVPSSDYYMTMPKPEPLQIFFLAIFLYFYKRNEGKFSRYWIFAGLALGTKISVLPALMVFSIVSLVLWFRGGGVGTERGNLSEPVIAFGGGLALAVPILIAPIMAVVAAYFVSNFISVKYRLNYISGFVVKMIAVLLALLITRSNVKNWASWTFLNTTHGADQASVNIFSWVSHVVEIWFNSNYFLSAIFFGSIFLYVLLSIGATKQLFNYKAGLRDCSFPVVVIVAGLVMNFAVMLGVKRLWGFYLYTGAVLMIVGLVALVEANLLCVDNKDAGFKKDLFKIYNPIVIGLILFTSIVYWMPNSLWGLNKYSIRTEGDEYKLQYAAYKEISIFLDEHASQRSCCFKVMYSPALFPAENSDKYEIVEFWGPYVEWEKGNEVIILSNASTGSARAVSEDSPEYNAFLAERNGYANHVFDKVNACKRSPCYRKISKLPNGGEILLLIKGN